MDVRDVGGYWGRWMGGSKKRKEVESGRGNGGYKTLLRVTFGPGAHLQINLRAKIGRGESAS
jgi:hypothetical protein